MTTPRPICLLLGLLAVLAREVAAQERNITELDLETLMNMDVTVTSAARRTQLSSDAAAAVFVITREDIRRSGATSIPELLRMAPGVEVARASNSRWAISTRGFNSRFAKKLLVLIDGRSVYTHLFAGVSWEYQQVPLDEIERIEVVRGPGGALWGANAVNGVINIITKSAKDSAGLRVAAGVGDEYQDVASIHFGNEIDGGAAFRTYFEQFQRDAYQSGDAPWRHYQGGWRLEGRTGADSTYSLQGDVSRDDLGDLQFFAKENVPFKDTGANINFNWNRAFLGDGRLSAQSSYSWREAQRFGICAEREEVFDLNLQYNMARTGRHLVTVGGGWRIQREDLASLPELVTWNPRQATIEQESLYAQDEIFLFSDAVRLTAGAKLEEYKYSGFALLPTARALWHINEQNTVWTAYSRAVRTPSRFERTATLIATTVPGSPPVTIVVNGNPDLDEEKLNARELGWRWRPAQRLTFDLALYENNYTDIAATTELPPEFSAGPPPQLVINQLIVDTGRARTRGGGLTMDWLALPKVRIQAFGSWLHLDAPDVRFLTLIEGTDPKESYSLRMRNDLPFDVELDLTYRYVAKLPTLDIPAYDSVGLRLGWNPARQWILSLNVDNLLNNVHREFIDEQEGLAPGDRIGRSFFLRARWYSVPK